MLNELHALAEKKRGDARAFPLDVGFHIREFADELTELLGKVVVTDEMVERACIASLEGYTPWDHPSWNDGNQRERLRNAIRAAIEAALGVTE